MFLSNDIVSVHSSAPNKYLCFAARIQQGDDDNQWRVDVSALASGAVDTLPLLLAAGDDVSSLTARSVQHCIDLLKSFSWEQYEVQAAQDHFDLNTEDIQAALAWGDAIQTFSESRPTGSSINDIQIALAKRKIGKTISELRPHRLTIRARLFGHMALPTPYVLNDAGHAEPAYSNPTTVSAALDVLSPNDIPAQRDQTYLFLDRKYEDIVEGDILIYRGRSILQDSKESLQIESQKIILAVETVSVSGYGISGEVTRITVNSDDLYLQDVELRSVEIFTGSESLELAPIPIKDPIGAGSTVDTDNVQLLCEGALLDLAIGQDVALTGLRHDAAGVASAQILRISKITLHGAYTALNFESSFNHPYVRSESEINANLALASHGETLSEAIGSGDGTQANQSFLLNSNPLTYLPANTLTGRAPSIEIRVNGMRWERVDSLTLAGPTDRVYTVTSIGMEPSKITFGNGKEGARLPMGENNITGTYRVGAGSGGRVEAGLITLLVQKPLGIRAVTNPLPAFGGSQAERREQARKNIPVKSLTLGRIVSLNDYRNFARSFSGIAKAHASWGWQQENRIACITVAAEDGKPLPESDGILPLLRQKIREVSAPGGSAVIKNFQPIWTALSAKVFIDANAVSADGTTDALFENIRTHLSAEFSFTKQALGAPIRLAHVASIIQSIEGVIAVDIDHLHRRDSRVSRQEIIRAYRPLIGERGKPRGIELLMMAPENIQLGVAG